MSSTSSEAPDPQDIIEIEVSSNSSPVECVRYGYVKPLVDALRAGATEECKAAADWLERFAEDIRLSAWEDFKKRICVAYVLALEKLRWPRDAAVNAVRDKLGEERGKDRHRSRSRSYVYDALSEYEDDPECQAGKFVLPLLPSDILEDLYQARTDKDPESVSKRKRNSR
jgi:hypothetical protein